MTFCDGGVTSSSPLEDSTTELSPTDDVEINNSTTTITRKPDEFFDPTWQLAITIEFYIQYAVIVIGVFGVAANGLVLYALISHHARQAKKRAVNLLMINQNLLDFTSCVLLVVTYSIKVSNIYLTGALWYFICIIFVSENSANSTLIGSIINLMALTVERYLKVVHPFWSRKYLKRWMIYAAMVFSWVGGILTLFPAAFVSTLVDDGICVAFVLWESKHTMLIIIVWHFCSYLVVPVVLFVFCYGRIVAVMRRQMKVMAAHNVDGPSTVNTSQLQSKRVKWNVIKTMIIVSVAYVICFFPYNIYFIIVDASTHTSTGLYVGYCATVFLSYIYLCMNPFIYAIKHEGVKEELVRLMSVCRKRRVGGNVVDVALGNIGNPQ